MALTFAEAKAQLRDAAMTLTKRDGEYRVNVQNGKEATAYYTTDLHDAVATGEDLRRREQKGQLR